jgi:L-alanine-DL-glutamate epimerase-like enolase superfamily enzyme
MPPTPALAASVSRQAGRNFKVACIPAGEHRLALVIGNGAYQAMALKNPVNDAKAMAATLQTLGFDAMMMTDASLRQMQQAIIAFGQKIQKGGVGLFYYAGPRPAGEGTQLPGADRCQHRLGTGRARRGHRGRPGDGADG